MLLFFGGSFDPVHIGHLILARDVREYFGYRKVIFIPAYISPFKIEERHRASAEDRLKMLRLALDNIPYFGIETYEIRKKEVSYTYNTVRYLLEEYDLQKVDWLMGDDTFFGLNKWFRWRELLKLMNPVVVLRNSTPEEVKKFAEELGLENLKLYTARRIEVSSTEIRNRVKEGKDIKFLVPESVEEYIKQKELYLRC
jgi:nicotinate-nucleotide adenylyltransferase